MNFFFIVAFLFGLSYVVTVLYGFFAVPGVLPISKTFHYLSINQVEVNILIQTSSRAEPGRTFVERCLSQTCIFDSINQRHNLDDIVPYDEIPNYLRPERDVPSLHLTSSMAFTLYIVIKPIPYAVVT